MPEIESIKVKKDFPTNPFTVGQEYKLEDFINCDERGRIGSLFREFMLCCFGTNDKEKIIYFLENNSEFFEIEHEPDKPKLLKRAYGSLISEVAFGVETYQIRVLDNKYFVQAIQYEEDQKWLLMEGRVFLTQDIRLAQEKAQMLTKQVEIQFEIDRLNAESIDNKYWSIKYNDFKKKFEIYSFEVCGVTLPENYKMTCKTAETILAKFSQDEIKQYLGI